MKAMIRKIAVCFLLIACTAKSYGQSDMEKRFVVQVKKTLHNYIPNEPTSGGVRVNIKNGDPVFVNAEETKYFNGIPESFILNGFCYKERPYIIGDRSFSCSNGGNTLECFYEGPSIIKNIYFKDNNNVINISSYACSGAAYYIALEIENHNISGVYSDSHNIRYVIECKNEGGSWVLVDSDKSSDFAYTSIGRLVAAGIDPYQNFTVRTKSTLFTGEYSTSTSTKTFRLFPKFEFPAGKSVIVEPPKCAGGNTIVKIPYTDNTNYTIEIKQDRDGNEYGDSKEANSLQKITENGTNYYVYSATLPADNYILNIEYKQDQGSPCPFTTTFTVPEVLPFEIATLAVTNYTDNNNTTVQIRTINGTVPVTIPVQNSSQAEVDIYNGSTKLVSATLANSVIINNITYYSGDVVVNLSKGTYNLQAKNTDCETGVKTIILNEPAAITFNTATFSPSCNTQNIYGGNTANGKIILSNINGGIGNYQYKIDYSFISLAAGITEATIENRSAKTYSITVADSYGNATTIDNIAVAAPEPIVIQNLLPTPPSMWCLSDGSISVEASGGRRQLQFGKTRSQFDFVNTLTGYPAGTGYVYVKDSCGCVIRSSKVIPPPPAALSVSSKIETSPTCPGGDDGKCVFQLANRQGTLSVSVDPAVEQDSIFINGNTVSFNGLLPGKYNCIFTQTLASGVCSLDTSFFISPKHSIAINCDATPVSDKGSATGKITANFSGGNSSPYRALLFDAQNNLLQEQTSSGNCLFANLSGSPDGKLYKISVTDSKGCPKDTTIQLFEPVDSLQLTATLSKPVSCYGSSDAEIRISAIGGWGEYEYSPDSVAWNAQAVLTGYPAGTYTFYVRDKYSGTATATLAIAGPQPLNITSAVTNVSCFGTATGAIRFRVTGGTAPYSLSPALGTVSSITENDTVYLTVNGLPAGSYTFTLKDGHDCTLQAEDATIGQPAKLTVSTANLTQPTCGHANGSLTATAAGGIAPYIYVLKNVETNAVVQTKESAAPVEFENIASGKYYIAVSDANGCTEPCAEVTFEQYVNPAIINAAVDDVLCSGETNGKITVSAQTGTANIDYFALTKTSNNTTIQSSAGIFENLPAGDYTLFVFDTNACWSQNAYPVTVRQPGELRIEIDTVVPAINKGMNDGKIRFRILGGNTGNVRVYLKDAGNTKTDSVSTIRGFTCELPVKAGEYTLEAIDSKDCIFTSATLLVSEPSDSLCLIIKEVKDALCKSQTGKISVEGSGGWGGYRYRRGDGQYSTLNRFENLYPGTYLITVTDKMGATASRHITVYEPQDSLKAEIINIQTPTCAANGVLSVNLSGGTPPYRLFSAAGNDTIFSAQPATIQWTNLQTGALMLHLTDANGCKFEIETVIPDTALLHITGLEILPPNVPQAPTGSIKVNTAGGTNPISYRWRKIGDAAIFPDNPQITNLLSGYYELKVTDSSGCSITESVYLPGPNDATISVVETGDETSVAAANGYAILYSGLNLTDFRVINPGNNYTDYPATTNNATFHISNDTIYLNHLASGKWFVAGTNAAGQNAVAGFEIQAYKPFIFSKIEIVHVSIPNGADGAAGIEVQGGAGENSFIWTDENGNILASNDSDFTSKLNNLPAGKYTLQVIDRFGNVISTGIEILAPGQALQLNIPEQKNQSCNGEKDAYILLEATGGWGDYRYAHYREAPTGTIEYHNSTVYSGLETGDHYFYVVDKYGVTATLKTTVTEPDILRANVAKIENAKCKDDVNGQVRFSVSGGNPPYYFKESRSTIWTKGHIADNLPAGEYTFEFTDSLQCASPDILTVTVTEPDSLLFRQVDITHTTCGEDNGQIAVSLQGGTRPYLYQWKDSEDNVTGADSILSNLKQNALYRLYVTDGNGCTQYLEQFIRPSKPPRIVNVEIADVLCYGDSTGAARITAVEAGEPYAPYLFTWSNGDSGDSADRLPVGRHSVTVSDTNNCATTYYFNITQPDSLYLLITDYREPHCFGYSDGYIETRTVGGAGDYTYLWSNGATTPNVENIPAGNYWVHVTDGNGCMFEKQFTLNEPAYQSINLGEDILMCPGNTHVIDGGDYVSYRWFTDGNDRLSTGRYLSVTEAGKYYLEATTPDGCPAWGDIAVVIGNSALQADMLLASEAAVGDTLFIFELSSLPLDSLKWEYDPAVFERITIEDDAYNLPYVLLLRCLQTGIYNIGLSAYSGGCFSPAVKQIEIVEAGDDDEDDLWGAKEPVIQSLTQYPNPSDGRFSVELKLREAAEARFVIFEVSSGMCQEQRTATDSDYYRIDYDLARLQTGVYVLIVTVGNERRQIKIVIE